MYGFLVVQFLGFFERIHVFLSFLFFNEFTVYYRPAIRRTVIHGEREIYRVHRYSVCVLLSAAVRIHRRKLKYHVVHIIKSFGFGNTELVCPVLAVHKRLSCRRQQLRNTVNLAINCVCIKNTLRDTAEVFVILNIGCYVPEHA